MDRGRLGAAWTDWRAARPMSPHRVATSTGPTTPSATRGSRFSTGRGRPPRNRLVRGQSYWCLPPPEPISAGKSSRKPFFDRGQPRRGRFPSCQPLRRRPWRHEPAYGRRPVRPRSAAANLTRAKLTGADLLWGRPEQQPVIARSHAPRSRTLHHSASVLASMFPEVSRLTFPRSSSAWLSDACEGAVETVSKRERSGADEADHGISGSTGPELPRWPDDWQKTSAGPSAS